MMGRPMYETEADALAEGETIAVVQSAWRCTAEKLPISYRVDYALIRDSRVRAFVEIKCRAKRYPTIMLSLGKVHVGLALAKVCGVPFLLIVRWPDGIAYTEVTPKAIEFASIGGRRDRGDVADLEPVVHFAADSFKPIKGEACRTC